MHLRTKYACYYQMQKLSSGQQLFASCANRITLTIYVLRIADISKNASD